MAIKDILYDKFFQGIISALATVLAAGMITIATPLKDKLISLFIKEDLDIVMTTDVAKCYEGDQFELFITIQSRNIVGSKYGSLLTVNYPAFDGKRSVEFHIPSFEQSHTVADKKIFVVCEKPGDILIESILKTQFKEYNKSKNISSLERTSQTKPSAQNLSGSWNIVFSHQHGSMNITDKKGSIYGFYEIGDTKGGIKGTRDGKIFKVHFDYGNSPTVRFSVTANYTVENNMIQIVGNIVKIKFDSENKEWVELGKPQEFVATSSMI